MFKVVHYLLTPSPRRKAELYSLERLIHRSSGLGILHKAERRFSRLKTEGLRKIYIWNK